MTSWPAMGWPFLVASGRHRDYNTILAPDFLVTEVDYGILNQVLDPTSESGPAKVIEVRTAGGRDLTVVFTTHLLTTADLDPGQAAPVGPIRDEHNRPLRLIYGFACPDTGIAEAAETDLATARAAALTAYRPFLANEDRLTVAPSRPFPLHSVTRPRVAPVRPSPFQVAASASGHGERRTKVWLAASVVAVCAALIAIVASLGGGRPPVSPSGCAVTPTATPWATPSPSCSPSRHASRARAPQEAFRSLASSTRQD